MKKQILSYILITPLVTALIIELIHILAHSLFKVITYSNLLDGMPFYSNQSYINFIKESFTLLFFISFVFFIVWLTYFYLLKRLVGFFSKKEFKIYLLTLSVYFVIIMVYFDFFAHVSVTGPAGSVPVYDIVLRILLLLIIPIAYLIKNKKLFNN